MKMTRKNLANEFVWVVTTPIELWGGGTLYPDPAVFETISEAIRMRALLREKGIASVATKVRVGRYKRKVAKREASMDSTNSNFEGVRRGVRNGVSDQA